MKRDRFCSLTLQSLSLNNENCFPRMSFEESSFENGSLEELDETLAHSKLEQKAETNSFQSDSLTKATLAQEAGTNSFFKSFSYRIWSLRMCLRMLLFCSFQFISAALILRTCFCTSSFPKESLQEEQLVPAYFIDSFQPQSLQITQLEAAYQLDQCTSLSFTCCSIPRCSRSTLESFNQLDLEHSLGFTEFVSTKLSDQLQADSFDRISFELRAFRGAASFQIRIRQRQLQSFQLPKQQLNRGFVQGGAASASASTLTSLSLAQDAWLKPSDKRACRRRTSNTALTLTSLSLAQDAWLNTSSLRAWNRSTLQRSLCTATCTTRTFPTISSHRSASMRPLQTTSFRRLASASTSTTSSRRTSSFSATLSCFSFLFISFYFNNSLEACPLGLLHGHLGQAIPSFNHLQDHSFIQKIKRKKQKQQLSGAVLHKELAQLQLDNLEKNKNNKLHHHQLSRSTNSL